MVTSRHSKLLEVSVREATRVQSLRRLWSTRLGDAVRYTLFRSRGFVYRKGFYLWLDLLEVFGLSLVADPRLFRLAGLVAVANFVILLSVDAVLQNSRAWILSGQKVLTGFIPVVSFAVVAALSFAFLGQISWHGIARTALAILVLRTLTTFFIAATDIHVARINFLARVYFPPKYNVIAVAAAALAVTVSVWRGGFGAVVGILVSGFAIRLWLQFVFWRLSRKEGKNHIRENWMPSQVPMTVVQSVRSTLLRTGFILSHFLEPLALITLFPGNRLGRLVAFIWVLKNLVTVVSERAYRARYVDFLYAYLDKKWDFLEGQVRLATVISFASAVLLYPLSLVVAQEALGRIPLSLQIWGALAIANRLLSTVSLLGGVDRVLSPYFVGLRFLVFPLLISAGDLKTVVNGFLAIESVLFFVSTYHLLRLRFPSYWEFSDFKSRRYVPPTPRHFFTCLTVYKEIFDESVLETGLFMIVLKQPIRSEERMRALLGRMAMHFRFGDLLLAVNARTIFLLAPTARTVDPILLRLMHHFPLVVQSCRPAGENDFFKAVAVSQNSGPRIPVTSLLGSPERLVAFLQESSKGLAGKWWVRSGKGDWIGSEGAASAERNFFCHKVWGRELGATIFQRFRKHSVNGSDEIHLAFKPWGETLAVYSCSTVETEFPPFWNALNHRFLSSILSSERTKPFELSPAEFISVRSEIQKFSKVVGVRLKREGEDATNVQSIGWTLDGWGRRRELAIVKERPTFVRLRKAA